MIYAQVFERSHELTIIDSDDPRLSEIKEGIAYIADAEQKPAHYPVGYKLPGEPHSFFTSFESIEQYDECLKARLTAMEPRRCRRCKATPMNFEKDLLCGHCFVELHGSPEDRYNDDWF